MERAPCCEMGLKKGPWTPEEDQILINYIQLYGHGNWRALPKQAGLLRCGKSCRLRWTNYLRPDIERGNFSREEEEPMFNLHEMSGNRLSASAARLPGRTDNEMGSLASSNPPSFHHTLSKPKSFWSETFLKITATVLLLLLFSSPITSKSLVSASRPMKPSVGATAAATEVSALNRAPTPPSCPSTSTYIPGGGVGGHC